MYARYLEIMEAEGFEISQPALDPASSDSSGPCLLIHRGLVQGSDECYLTKGIIVETTHLRLRSLVMEKDSKVAVVELNICVSYF